MALSTRLMEFLFPWRRVQSIERELDAEERIAAWKMKEELWQRQSAAELSNFNQPLRFTRFLGQ